jgi:hypothetical protein
MTMEPSDKFSPQQLAMLKEMDRWTRRVAQQEAAGLSRLHEIIRTEWLRLCDDAGPVAGKHGDEIASLMRIKAEDLRMEGLREWWAGRESPPGDLNKLEDDLVMGFGEEDPDKHPNLLLFLSAESKSILQSLADQVNSPQWPPTAMAMTVSGSYVAAWMTLRRTDTVPPVGFSETETRVKTIHVSALEGLREMLAAQQWSLLAAALGSPEWLQRLTRLWLADRIADEKKRQENQNGALKLAEVRRYTVGSCEIGMIPKESAGISWAWGGQGVLDSDNRFGIAPDIGVIALPPGATLLRGRDSEKWPFQTLLPLDDSESGKSDTGIPLVMTLAGGQREMMPAATGKLALLIMDGCHRNRGGNGMIETNLRDLTRIINPGRDGKLQASHYNTVLQALHSLAMLRVVLPGDFSSYAVFDCPLPYRTATPSEYDKPIWLGMARGFTSVITQACPSYKGFFVFNLSGCMRLDTKRPALLRQYIRAAAEWNHLRIVQKKGPPTIRMEIERWALMVNTLSAGAIKAMNGSLQQRRKKSEDIKTTREELEELHERGLLILEKAGKSSSRGEIILRCPDDLEEAWQDRKGAAPTRNPRK